MALEFGMLVDDLAQQAKTREGEMEENGEENAA
jgi:hypothetical protein